MTPTLRDKIKICLAWRQMLKPRLALSDVVLFAAMSTGRVRPSDGGPRAVGLYRAVVGRATEPPAKAKTAVVSAHAGYDPSRVSAATPPPDLDRSSIAAGKGCLQRRGR